jgi:competence protein ComEA
MVRRFAVWSVVFSLAAVSVAPVLAQQSPNAAPKPPSKAQAKADSIVNLNTASAADFESLPGIGKSTAQRIVEYRQKSGGFKKIEELMNVKGIGEKSFLRLKPLITVAPPKTEKAGGTR